KDFNQPTINYTCQVRITECFIPANRMLLALGNAIAALGMGATLPHLLFSTRIPAQILWYCE
ncbi:hypothetical protein POG23_12585, partial [Limnoraphis robusta]|nr:hypothetical protein [Limnoraphis robusta]